jgi:hypothetical protein
MVPLEGPKITSPFGKRFAPLYDPVTGVEFENVSAIGSNIPMFPVRPVGAITTFPEGKRQPPLKDPPQGTFDMVDPPRTVIFAEVPGTQTTFPPGTRTPPANPVTLATFVTVCDA